MASGFLYSSAPIVRSDAGSPDATAGVRWVVPGPVARTTARALNVPADVDTRHPKASGSMRSTAQFVITGAPMVDA